MGKKKHLKCLRVVKIAEIVIFFYVATSRGRSFILLGNHIVQTCYMYRL